MCRNVVILVCFFSALAAHAITYHGVVLDEKRQPLPYATIYPISAPDLGTATNSSGYFAIQTKEPLHGDIIVSFIGYEKLHLPAEKFTSDTLFCQLKEQPIALEQTVVSAKKTKNNKNKKISALLYKVYNQMLKDFSDAPAEYHIVSDVRMDAQQQPWGMEQMVASVVHMPRARRNGKDSVQFHVTHCKRFFQQTIRQRADDILSDERIDKRLRKQAVGIDSGIILHQGLFVDRNIVKLFEDNMNDIKHWKVSNESEKETILTHSIKKNYLGIITYEITLHYIIDSETFSVRRCSQSGNMKIIIPFGKKLDEEALQLLNLFNMSEQSIEKFRLRRARGSIALNTLFQRRDGHLYFAEKNLVANAFITGSKKVEIPLKITATQHVTDLKTVNVKTFPSNYVTKKVQRTIVPIY